MAYSRHHCIKEIKKLLKFNMNFYYFGLYAAIFALSPICAIDAATDCSLLPPPVISPTLEQVLLTQVSFRTLTKNWFASNFKEFLDEMRSASKLFQFLPNDTPPPERKQGY
jgi:hypothetical protein